MAKKSEEANTGMSESKGVAKARMDAEESDQLTVEGFTEVMREYFKSFALEVMNLVLTGKIRAGDQLSVAEATLVPVIDEKLKLVATALKLAEDHKEIAKD